MMRTSHSMNRRRNDLIKGDIFENMDTQSSSSEEKGHLQKWVKKTKQPDQNERLKGTSNVPFNKARQVTMVTVVCPRILSLNRSCTHALNCAVGRMSVVKPWEKGNAHGLEF
jgi:hypothetical protein